MKRSAGFEQALASIGVRYEYWGRELGEDAAEGGASEGLLRTLGQLVAQSSQQTVCLMGHLHETQGCHRLKLCELMLGTKTGTDLNIVHLLWENHKDVKQLQHSIVASEAAEVLRFFEENKMRAEAVREGRMAQTPEKDLEVVAWDRFNSSLFRDGKPYHFLLPFNTELFWYPQWLSADKANELERTVRERVTFLHPTYMFQEPGGGFAKTLIKRGQVRICGDDCPGAISTCPLEAWSSHLLQSVEDSAGVAFNCFVANHYAHGQVVINWHSDSGPGDDEGLGPNPHIGSLSLGAARTFSLKSKRQVGGRIVHLDIPLTHGSLLIMGNNSQTHWLHALLHEDTCVSERINLTFRFYARQSTKHIEGMEHNHEWEAAPGSTRVLFHRPGFGRPVHIDLPDDLMAYQLPKYALCVLPGHRGARHAVKVQVRSQDRSWRQVESDASIISEARKCAKANTAPEVCLDAGGGSFLGQKGGKGYQGEFVNGHKVSGNGKGSKGKGGKQQAGFHRGR